MNALASWLILCCSRSKTLELAKSLAEVGFEVWAPVTRDEVRVGEQRTREDTAVPLMPSFVFARARHLHTLLALSHSPSLQYRVWDAEEGKHVTKGHPHFRLFRGGNHRFVPDRELEPLRRLERKPRPKRVERSFTVGDQVRTDDEGFAGLIGVVTMVQGKMVQVRFGKWRIEPKFPAWALRPIDEPNAVNVNATSPECDAA